MIMPVLEIVTGSNSSGGTFKYIQPLVERFSPEHSLVLVGGLMIALFLFKSLFTILKIAFSARFVNRLRYTWTMGIMWKYMHAVYSYHVSQRQGFLLNNVSREPSIAAKSIFIMITFASDIFLFILLYGLLLFVNWQATLVITICAGLLLGFFLRVSHRYSTSVGRRKLLLAQEITAIASENINGVRQIKIFSFENEAFQRLGKKLHNLIRIIVKYAIVISLPGEVTQVVSLCGIVGVLFFVKFFTEVAIFDIIPTLGLFVVTLHRLLPTFSRLFSTAMSINTLLPSLELVHALNNEIIDTEDLDKGEVVSSLETDIVFDNVFFSYNSNQPLFESLSFTIPRGGITALVGVSGSGKSTIIDLLTGFYCTQRGMIRINGMDINGITMNSWRALVGYVSQEAYLFSASVRDNILMGKPAATEEEVYEAARKANADEFIREMSQGYESKLGERGLNISGGQRQRIALARALIRDPQVLILDEATSSLDRESELLIQGTIESFAGHKTVIIISHRLKMVQNADRIFVLESGRIVEQGRFDEMVDSNCRFNELAGA